MCHSQRSEIPVACRGHLKTLVLSWEKQPLDILSSITKEILKNNQCENILFLFDHWCRKPGHIIKSHEEKKHEEANNGKTGHLWCMFKLSGTAFTEIKKGNETESFDQLFSEPLTSFAAKWVYSSNPFHSGLENFSMWYLCKIVIVYDLICQAGSWFNLH